MSVREILKELETKNEELVSETFGDISFAPQFREASGEVVSEAFSLSGAKVSASPQMTEFYRFANGSANIALGERWASSQETKDPIISADPRVYEFDEISNPITARKTFDEQLDDEIFSYLDEMGHKDCTRLPESSALVLLGYNLIELGQRPTYLFFENSSKVEPWVWSSSINWTEIFDCLESFLDEWLS